MLVLLAPLPQQVRADETPASASEESGSSRKEILAALHAVQKRYGPDAVMIQGQLLGQAIRGGSIVDAAISIPGFEDRNGKRFLAFKLETGIIYNDHELAAAARPVRIWTDIVEISLRNFQKLTLPADGVGFILAYAHKAYADEADLRAHLADSRGEPEWAAFYLLIADLTELIANRITGQQLLDRSTVLVNGSPTRLVVDAPATSQ